MTGAGLLHMIANLTLISTFLICMLHLNARYYNLIGNLQKIDYTLFYIKYSDSKLLNRGNTIACSFKHISGNDQNPQNCKQQLSA